LQPNKNRKILVDLYHHLIENFNKMNFLLNTAAFYLAWFVCLYGATHNYSFLAMLFVTALLGVHLLFIKRRSEQLFQQDLCLVMFSVIVGSVMETTLMLNHLQAYASPNPIGALPPFWIIALYAFFGTTINHSMKWLKGRIKLAFIVGSVGGPLCYLGGAKINAVTFSVSLVEAYSVLALTWGFFVASIFWLQVKLDLSQARID
jgi:hypothetical protein